jgi:hypothetical protein
MTGSIILNIAYGLDIQPENDPLIRLEERALEQLVYAATPGKWLVVSVLDITRPLPGHLDFTQLWSFHRT